MKKQLFRTLVAIGVLSAMMAFGACTEKENVTTDDSINNNIEDAISVETPRSIIMGSDGNLYITAYYPRSVARYDLTKKAITAICELGNYQPEGIAETILFLASEQARMLTGQVIKVSGGHAI